MSKNSINLRDFKVEGYDPFYTRSVFFYIRNVGITSVSSFKEIDSLKAQVKKAMLSDKLISDRIDKVELINGYFTELNIAFRSLNKGVNEFAKKRGGNDG